MPVSLDTNASKEKHRSDQNTFVFPDQGPLSPNIDHDGSHLNTISLYSTIAYTIRLYTPRANKMWKGPLACARAIFRRMAMFEERLRWQAPK